VGRGIQEHQLGFGIGTQAGWVEATGFAFATDQTFTVPDTAANQAAFCKGRELRYDTGAPGDLDHGIVYDYTAGTIIIAGVPLSNPMITLEWSSVPRTIVEYIHVPGLFADGADATLIENDLRQRRLWQYKKAYCVQQMQMCLIQDTGMLYPNVLAIVAASDLITAPGLQVVSGALISSGATINPACYEIEQFEPIELSTDAGGSNNDSQDLNVWLTFVLE